MCKKDWALNNLQGWICHKIKPNQTSSVHCINVSNHVSTNLKLEKDLRVINFQNNFFLFYCQKGNKSVGWLVGWVLWHINLCRLFNAKSTLMQIVLIKKRPCAILVLWVGRTTNTREQRVFGLEQKE